MTVSLTYPHARPAGGQSLLRPVALSLTVLVALAMPVWACDKAASALPATAAGGPRVTSVFTGEFVDGAPVSRLPAITVVGRRDAEIARTPRDDASAHGGRSRANSAAATASSHKVTSALRDVNATRPCVG